MNFLEKLGATDGDHLTDSKTGTTASAGCARPLKGPDAAYIPNIIVQTHDGRKALFHDDLLVGKKVLISSVSTQDSSSFAIIENLAKVQPLIGEAFGRQTFIYSITTDPENDTPQVLRSFAEKYGARDGWLFLTGEPTAIKLLRERLFNQSGHDCAMTLLRYGSPSIGLWGGIPATAHPESIAERLSWLEEGTPASGVPRRKGPPALAVND